MQKRYLALALVLLLAAAAPPVCAESPTDLTPPQGRGEAAALPDGSAVVYDYTGLKEALSQDNQITAVYLGADIVLEGGIDIHPAKTAVTIDGIDPTTPGDGTRHTLTDYNSAAQSGAIRVNAAGIRSVLLRDLNLVGRNYYGTVTVSELYGSPEAVITYERVSYSGPQMGFHRQGTLRFKDCDIDIHGENSALSAQEVAEAKHLIFEGDNTIATATSAYSVFWLPGGGSVTLAPDASLVLDAPSPGALYGIFYCGGALNPLRVTVGVGAQLDVYTGDGFAPASGCQLKELTVREGGVFRLISTKSPTAAVLTVGGAFTVEPGASFFFLGLASSSFAAVRQDGGTLTVGQGATFHITASAPYLTLLNLFGATFVSDDAASVLLGSTSRPIRAELSAGTVRLSAQQVNYRSAYTDAPADSPPDYKWEKPSGNFTLEASVAVGDGANLAAITSNYVDGEPPGTPPTVTNFSVKNARILAWGNLEATITAAKAGTAVVGGVTAPGAQVRVYLRGEAGEETLAAETTADHSGVFHADTGAPLAGGTVVTAAVDWNYLSAQAEAVVTDEGRLTITAPETLEFVTTPISRSAVLVRRAQPDWQLTVTDTRGAGASWRLCVELLGDLTPADGKYPPLPGAVVYVWSPGEAISIPVGAQEELFSHTTREEEDIFPVVWQEDCGPLLYLIPLDLCANMPYATTLIWTVIDGP